MNLKKLRIIMLGESLARQGGIVSVEKIMLQSPSNIQIKHIGTLVNGSVFNRMLGFGRAIVEFIWMLLRTEFDIVHIHVSERGSAWRKAILTLIALIFRKPVILHAHGPEFRSFYANLPQALKQGLSWVFGKCDRFIVLSNRWKNFYVSNVGLNAEQVVVLPNPVQLPTQVPNRINSAQIRFVFLGRIGQRKGTFDLIRAFATMPSKYKNRSRLVMAGDGDIKQAQSLIADLNLSDRITIFDWLDSEKRDALLAQADVFVLPSYNEGLPMSLLEAMSWGLPVITTPVGGIPELVIHGQNGLLINPGDIQQLSKAMQCLVDDENLRLRLGSNARESVKTLDVKYYFEHLIDIYESVLALKQQSYVGTTY